jgi:hypothetical protein
MIVVAIVIIISVTAVALTGPYVQRRQLEAAAFQLTQDLRLVQSNALFARNYLWIRFDTSANTYTFEKADFTTVTRSLNGTIGFASSVLGTTAQGASVYITSLILSPPQVSCTLYFTPWGSPAYDANLTSPVASGGVIVTVASRSGYRIQVSVSNVLGVVTMTWLT